MFALSLVLPMRASPARGSKMLPPSAALKHPLNKAFPSLRVRTTRNYRQALARALMALLFLLVVLRKEADKEQHQSSSTRTGLKSRSLLRIQIRIPDKGRHPLRKTKKLRDPNPRPRLECLIVQCPKLLERHTELRG